MKFNTKFTDDYNKWMDSLKSLNRNNLKTINLPSDQAPITAEETGEHMNIKTTIQRKLNKKLGIWLIYIGVAMPFVLYPLTSLSTNDINLTMGYANARMHYDAPLLNREIVFFAEDVEGLKTVINYSTVIFLGLLLSFLGGGIIIYSYNKKD